MRHSSIRSELWGDEFTVNTARTSKSQKWPARWDRRIIRVHELQSEYAAAKSILKFYEVILKYQANVACNSSSTTRSGIALREQFELSSLVSAMPSLLTATIENGTKLLCSEAQRLQHEGEGYWRTLLETAVKGDASALSATEDFFARTCLQPAAENLQVQTPPVSHYIGTTCPICGGLAQLAVLRPEGEGASRSLHCSFCLHEWPFRRIACPWCGEEDKEKLPRYTPDECDSVHVEACETCKRYLKAVDMSKNGLAVPLVDEASWPALDIWAADHGYTKIIRNLVGF